MQKIRVEDRSIDNKGTYGEDAGVNLADTIVHGAACEVKRVITTVYDA